MAKQVWIPTWIDKRMPIRSVSKYDGSTKAVALRVENSKNLLLRGSFNHFIGRWDENFRNQTTYDIDILETQLGYAKEDLNRTTTYNYQT